MAELTEIYICAKGQALKEGKVVYSDEIHTKKQAIPDAKMRCDRDSKIAKIAYYTVTDDGQFRCIYTHTAGGGAEAPKPPKEVKRKRPAQKKKPKPTLWQKITGRG